MIGPLVLATALMGGPWSPKLPPWPDVDRRSPKLVAKLERQKKARHQTAAAGRQEFDARFDEAMRILRSPPDNHPCPCSILGARL